MGNELTDGERLAALEADVKALTSIMARVEAKIDAMDAKYVTHDMIVEMFRLRDDQIRRLEESRKGMRDWLAVAIAGIALLAQFWPKK